MVATAAILLALTWQAAASAPSRIRLLQRLAEAGGLDGAAEAFYSASSEGMSQAPARHSSASTRLHGRFLHITDIHPDPHYRNNASVNDACHWPASKADTPLAGYWGTPNSDCDSPMSLVNATFDWLAKRWAGQVDFVIWTGDSARHDIDSRMPRSFIEIVGLNEQMVAKMQQAFGPRTPIVPSIGNNDLYPHNIMFSGPNAVINSLQTIWRDMMPESEFHTFARGAYYAVEVAPGLMVVSLNTIYFFQSNKVVDGCPVGKKSQRDPGSEQLEWLETQLERWRREGKQAWLSGHVPPSPGLWYDNCDSRYKEIAIAFQDTILGHVFGHVNVDYFFLATETDDKFSAASSKGIEEGLKSNFQVLPKVSKLDLDEWAVFHVSPSVVPTYQPTVRIYTYNVTASSAYRAADDTALEEGEITFQPGAQQVLASHDGEVEAERKRRKRKGKKKKKNKKLPRLPRHASPHSPSRTNRYLSPLGYSQWMLDLDAADQAGSHLWPEWELEYTTYSQATVDRFLSGELREDEPSPFPWVNTTGADAQLLQKKTQLAPYGMADLTLPRWLDLAHKLGKSKRAWASFRRKMFVGTVHS